MALEKTETELDDKCKLLANKMHGNLTEIINDRDHSKRLCNVGLLLSPFVIGIPLAYQQCKKNHLIKQDLNTINTDWNQTYQTCIRSKK